MNKPDSLRAKLTTAFPELAKEPERLRMWIEQGSPRCWANDSLSFTLKYRLTVVIEEWRHPSIMIWILLIDWLRIQQPELLTPSTEENALQFEADLLSNEETDISFDLWLDEAVKVTRREDGGFDMQVMAEPDPLFPDAAPILPSRPLLEVVTLGGSVLFPDDLA